MIDRKKMAKVAAYDRFWQELHHLRYPLEHKRVSWLRKASVIRKKRKDDNIPEEDDYGEIKKYDVIVAGGGPSGTLYASMLAKKEGRRVLLVEKNAIHECGSTWNLSREEFEKFKSTKVLKEEQFEGLIEGVFERGDFRLWNMKDDSSSITVDNIDNWRALLVIIQGDTENFTTKLLTSKLKKANQLEKFKRIEVNQLTDEMKKNILEAFNTIKDSLTFYKDEVADKGIKLSPALQKKLNNLKEILEESGKLKKKESDLSDTQIKDIKWFNISILEELFPQILSIQKIMEFYDVLNLSIDETKYFQLLSNTPNLELRLGIEAVLNCITEKYAFVELFKGSLITVGNIDNWRALLVIIQGDTENFTTKLLTSKLKKANQLEKFKRIEVNQLTDEMKEDIVVAFNAMKNNLTFYKDEVADKGIKLSPELKKELNNLNDILEESGELKKDKHDLTDSQNEAVKWFNINILMDLFPQILSKSLKRNSNLAKEGRGEMVKARLFIDATGWTSLLARTVNYERVVESWYNMIGIKSEKKLNFKTDHFALDGEGKPIGLICVTCGNEIMTKAGKVQPILERFSHFKSKNLEHTGDVIYYFTRTSKPVRLHPMFKDMEEIMHKILPEYDPSKVKTTYYGHAAGYYQAGLFSSRFHQVSAGDRTLMVGVAGQQYSGLTGCAFGCLARNAKNICDSIDKALDKNDLSFKNLQKIDIDPRERVSQSITDLYAGSMELDPYEDAGTVNRDWISFINIGKHMDKKTNADVLRDKIQFKTLRTMLRISADNHETIRSLFRNNRGHPGLVFITFIRGYLKLLVLEARYASKKGFQREYVKAREYIKAGIIGTLQIPSLFHSGLKFLFKSRKVGK